MFNRDAIFGTSLPLFQIIFSIFELSILDPS